MPSDPQSPFWHMSLQDEVGTDSRTNAQPVRGWPRKTLCPGSVSALCKKCAFLLEFIFFLMLLLKSSRNIFYMKDMHYT